MPWIWTPAVVRDHVAKTALQVDQVAREWFAAAKAGTVPASELKAVQGWQSAFHSFASNASDWSGATADASEAYRLEAAEYSAALAKRGGSTSPLVGVEPKGPADVVVQVSDVVAKGVTGLGKVALYGLAAAAGAYGLLRLVTSKRER